MGTYVEDLKPEESAQKDVFWNEVFPASNTELDISLKPEEPPIGIGHCKKLQWAKEIKAVVIIPDFEVPTSKAREVLPKMYSRADTVREVFILQVSKQLIR